MNLVLLAVYLGVQTLLGPALALSAVVLAGEGGFLVRRARSRRRRSGEDASLVVALRLAAADVTAGAPPSAALDAAADTVPSWSEPLHALASSLRRGRDPEPGWARDRAQLRGLLAAVTVSRNSGAPLAGVLTLLADDLSALARQHAEVTAALAETRASAVLLALLPLLGLALGAGMGADPLALLLGSRGGHLLLLAGILLEALGLLWVELLAERAGRSR